MKSTILAGTLLALSGIGLAACGGEASKSDTGCDGGTSDSAAPEGFPGIKVSDGRLVLPAVKGNPGAVYFNVDYTCDDIAVIRAVDVKGAKSAVMHDTSKGPSGEMQMQELLNVKVEKNKQLKFLPGGNHVMAMGLADTLKPGDSTEVTLTFIGGDKYSFPAKVEAAGSAR